MGEKKPAETYQAIGTEREQCADSPCRRCPLDPIKCSQHTENEHGVQGPGCYRWQLWFARRWRALQKAMGICRAGPEEQRTDGGDKRK